MRGDTGNQRMRLMKANIWQNQQNKYALGISSTKQSEGTSYISSTKKKIHCFPQSDNTPQYWSLQSSNAFKEKRKKSPQRTVISRGQHSYQIKHLLREWTESKSRYFPRGPRISGEYSTLIHRLKPCHQDPECEKDNKSRKDLIPFLTDVKVVHGWQHHEAQQTPAGDLGRAGNWPGTGVSTVLYMNKTVLKGWHGPTSYMKAIGFVLITCFIHFDVAESRVVSSFG